MDEPTYFTGIFKTLLYLSRPPANKEFTAVVTPIADSHGYIANGEH
jgi:hypothetical protein